jgi:hypothetical protein
MLSSGRFCNTPLSGPSFRLLRLLHMLSASFARPKDSVGITRMHTWRLSILLAYREYLYRLAWGASDACVSVALYGLWVFYNLTKQELNGKRPLAKFLAIKLIVFFTFYQAFVVSCRGIEKSCLY